MALNASILLYGSFLFFQQYFLCIKLTEAATMEDKMKKNRELSPERTRVWAEKSQKNRTRKVPVVYYLCKNRQLEHPHFMEVPLLSSHHLHLRDVIERLNVLRGPGIASMYSWSCKRSYKNGYVWNDLSDEDDVIYPAHGNEYIIKGSEIFEESNSGRFVVAENALQEPTSSRNREGSSSLSSSSSSSNGRDAKDLQEKDSLSLAENKNVTFADASTQTDESDGIVHEIQAHTCTRGVSTDDCLSEHNQSVGIDTLESLIRADIRKLNRFRILEEEGYRIPSSAKIKVANLVMQLVSCGSIPAYRSRLRSLGEFDRMATTEVGPKEKGRNSGSLAETSAIKKDDHACRNDKENVIKIEES